MPDNKDTARLLKKGARLLELYGENPFKIRSYEKAARIIESLDVPVESLNPEEIEKIEGIGSNLAKKIIQIRKQESYDELDRLLNDTPSGILELLNIKGIGTQKIRTAWNELGITSPEQLLEACRDGSAESLKGFGRKTVSNIREALEYAVKQRNKFLLSHALSDGEALLSSFNRLNEVESAVFTGPLRRRCEVIGQIDILLCTDQPDKVNDAVHAFETCTMYDDRLVSTKHHIPVNLHFANHKSLGTVLLRSTGNTQHLKYLSSALNSDLPAASSEELLYQQAGLPFVIPEMREGLDEFDRTKELNYGEIIAEEHLSGVLHAHTKYSDGRDSLTTMAEHCREMGYQYLGISDHSKSAFYAGGLQVSDLEAQWEEIDNWNRNNPAFRLLKGIESDILSDGSLDYPDEVLAEFDFIIASVHSQLNMDEQQSTNRIIKAVENPYTSMLGHPTARLLLTRKGYPLNHEKVLDACAANGVVVELNANPMRLDIDWRWLNTACNKGLYISVNPDAHSREGVSDMKYGVAVARKAGIHKDNILNTLPADKVAAILKKG